MKMIVKLRLNAPHRTLSLNNGRVHIVWGGQRRNPALGTQSVILFRISATPTVQCATFTALCSVRFFPLLYIFYFCLCCFLVRLVCHRITANWIDCRLETELMHGGNNHEFSQHTNWRVDG